MLDAYHELFPHVRIIFVFHFSHPHEFLEINKQGQYIFQDQGNYQWIPSVQYAINSCLERSSYITMMNQFPIIYRVNDNSNVLGIIQKELFKKGITNHYFFQCREIEGHRAFSVPVEESYQIIQKSQEGLSGIEKQARFVMSTQFGKLEVAGLTKENIIFKVIRHPRNSKLNGTVVIAKRNPKALWISSYLKGMSQKDIRVLTDFF